MDAEEESDDEEKEAGMLRFAITVAEAVQDSYYDLVLDFVAGKFSHSYRRTVFEGGDGEYETVYTGSFTKEVSMEFLLFFFFCSRSLSKPAK